MVEHALLFTDLVDSTAAVERLGDARAASVLAEHDRGARALLARHGGREIDHSDGFFLLFSDAAAAASFALAYHDALAGLGLGARAGLHVGAVTLRENDPEDVARGAKPVEVEGIAKPLAARVMSLARGGQTLLTEAARAALGDALAPTAAIRRHGHYRLKGIGEPVAVFELGRRDAAFVPPADTDKAYRVVHADDRWLPLREVRHNLPRERDAFVGRAADLAAIADRLEGGARLLTVVGPAGTGKTRLVRRYGWTWLGDWPGGVYFCDLSEARTLEGVLFVVAVALEIQLGRADPAVQLGHAIATRGRCLIVLDNFEHVVAHAPATVGAWIERTADAAFLVTSRERLHVAGETVLPLEPLSVDADGIELFALRARAHRPEFALTDANRAVVQRIVGLLDGLPLAIELAAARIGVLSPAQLVDRLADRFRVLAGARAPASRHATLRAAIEWSWQLLAPWEQAALAQCSIFEHGFTLDAAEAVLDLSAWPDAPAAIDALQALVDKSLLRSWIRAQPDHFDIDEPYFGMYLSIHDYAAEKLAESGAAVRRAAEERHGAYFAAMGSDAGVAALYRHGGGARRRALILDLDNIVAACRRAAQRGDGEQAVGALRAAWEAITTQGGFALAIELGTQTDAIEDMAPSLRAAALMTTARALVAAGRHEQIGMLYERALALLREAGDRRREAKALGRFGNALRLQGRMDDARRRFEEALAIHDALGEPFPGNLLAELGIVHRQTGAMDEARAWYERALAVDREVGDRDAEAKVLNNLAILHAEQGRFDEARARFEDSLTLSRELGDRRQAGLALANLGCLNLEQGRLDAAEEQLLAGLAIHRDTGERAEESHALANLAGVQQARGALDEARATCSAALAIAREVGGRRDEGSLLGQIGGIEHGQGRLAQARAAYDEALAIHRALGNRRYAGRTLSLLADLLAAEGRRDEARAALAEGETLLRELGEKLDLGSLLCTRGRLELDSGNVATASGACGEAERLADELALARDAWLRTKLAQLRTDIDAAAAPDDEAARPPTAR
jgi:predicted ATPase/class 3 adenylate cyclase/Tfp pilus assembly protein PilF